MVVCQQAAEESTSQKQARTASEVFLEMGSCPPKAFICRIDAHI